jgi:hypothetical protein
LLDSLFRFGRAIDGLVEFSAKPHVGGARAGKLRVCRPQRLARLLELISKQAIDDTPPGVGPLQAVEKRASCIVFATRELFPSCFERL